MEENRQFMIMAVLGIGFGLVSLGWAITGLAMLILNIVM